MNEIETLCCAEDGVFVWPRAALVVRCVVSFVRASERDIGNRQGPAEPGARTKALGRRKVVRLDNR